MTSKLTISEIMKVPSSTAWKIDQINMILAEKDAEIALAAGCLTRAGWEYIPDSIGGPCWKPPVNESARIARKLNAKLAEIEAICQSDD